MALSDNPNSQELVTEVKRLDTDKEEKTYKYTVTTTSEIPENTEYTIPCTYKVGEDVLDVYYEGQKLIKDTHYKEIGTDGETSTTIQFCDWGQSVPEGSLLEFVVKGVYE